MRRRRAFTLLEMLVWIAVITFLASLVSWLLVMAFDAARQSHRALESATVRTVVLERLGRDVRRSVRILARHAGGRTGNTHLILEAPGAGRIVYRIEDGVLQRQTDGDGKARVEPVGRVEELRFLYDKRGAAMSRWVEVHLPVGRGSALSQRFHLMNTEVAP